MARAQKKAKRTNKRPAKRRAASEPQSQSHTWTLGVGILGIAVLLGAAAYLISVNDEARTTVAGMFERVTPEIPASVKQFPDQVRQQLPAMPSLTKNNPAE